MSIANLLDPITAHGGQTRFSGLDQWMQGRTLYGGASALVAYTAATRAFPDLPPLRAAQVAFVGNDAVSWAANDCGVYIPPTPKPTPSPVPAPTPEPTYPRPSRNLGHRS